MAITLTDIKNAYSIRKNLHVLFVRSNDRWAFLDGYRGIGILWVIAAHLMLSLQYLYGMEWWRETVENVPFYFQWVFNADVAVDAFFVVSAFLISNALLRQFQHTQNIKIGTFYLSRYMRLSPVYFIAIGIYLLVQPGAWESKTIWPNFFYVQNFISNYEEYFMYFSWSLAIEEQFYLVLPPFLFFILLKSSRPLLWVLGLFVLSFIIRAAIVLSDDILTNTPYKELYFNNELFAHYFMTIYDNLYSRYGAFMCGIFLAYIYRYHSEGVEEFLRTKTAYCLTILSMFIVLALCLMPVLHKDFTMSNDTNLLWQIARRNIICLAAMWLWLCGLYSNQLAKRLNSFMSLKIFYPLGHLIYSMYLFHYLAVGFVMLNLHANIEYLNIDIREHLGMIMLLGFLLSAIGTITLAILSFLFIERPIMNLRPK